MKRITATNIGRSRLSDGAHFWEPSDWDETPLDKTSFIKKKVRYISEIPVKGGKSIFMAPCPWFSSDIFQIEDDYYLHFLKNGVHTVVMMLEDRKLVPTYKNWGFDVIHIPIRDFSIPKDVVSFDEKLHEVRRALKKHSVLFHCMGGNGRTGLVVASMFVQMGMDPDKAIDFVRKHRPEAIETREQEEFIREYYDLLN